MRILIFFQFLLMLMAGCAVVGGSKKNNELIDNIVGLYEYLPDSSGNSNRSFFELINIKRDYTFSYKSRMGEFIRIELSGSWILDGEQVVLTSDYQKENVFKSSDCPMKLQKGFSFDVKDLNGNYFNYDLIIDGKVKKGLYGKVILDSIPSIKVIRILSSSGFYSEEYKIDPDYNCYNLYFVNKRQFNEERWEYRGAKIKPLGLDGNSANYFLYKVSR